MQDKKEENINNKGFTLVELLATISILAIIMLIAIPNVVGVVQRNRNKTYVEDAKKMVALAKYKVKTDSKVKKELSDGNIICLYMDYLDSGKEINDAPNGGTYSSENSFVEVMKNYDDTYSYNVQLLETSAKVEYYDVENEENLQGLEKKDSKELSKDNIYKEIKTNPYPYSCSGSIFKK